MYASCLLGRRQRRQRSQGLEEIPHRGAGAQTPGKSRLHVNQTRLHVLLLPSFFSWRYVLCSARRLIQRLTTDIRNSSRLVKMVEKVYVTYNQVHKLCQTSADRILNDFKPNLMVCEFPDKVIEDTARLTPFQIAIGGGGYVPARILRSFLKKPGNPNIPIQAIGLSLYEQLGSDTQVEQPGTKVTRTQWLDLSSLEMANLIGKNVLIVDEVDDTRTTLEYAVKELQKDVDAAAQKAGRAESTKFSIFVLHNKDKEKKGHLPQDMIDDNRYLAARTVPDVWINYPWEAT